MQWAIRVVEKGRKFVQDQLIRPANTSRKNKGGDMHVHMEKAGKRKKIRARPTHHTSKHITQQRGSGHARAYGGG